MRYLQNASSSKSETRRIPISPHRFTPLKNNWVTVYTPLVQQYVFLAASQHIIRAGA